MGMSIRQFAFLASIAIFIAWHITYNCDSGYEDCHLHLGTKMAYRYIANYDDHPVEVQGCVPRRIWLMIRHGTRNPSRKVIIKMHERLPEIRNMILSALLERKGTLCLREILALKAWEPLVHEGDEKKLTEEGRVEMIQLAERFQRRFPELFPKVYSNSTYKFRHTLTQRTKESSRYFTYGLFGKKATVWFPEAVYNDPVLRFYKSCNRWRIEIDKNPASLRERIRFEEGYDMDLALRNVRERLGTDALTLDDVKLMYTTCAFETAWDWQLVSPWCVAFLPADMKIMEYAEDLEYYWIDGYGYELTYKQACPAIQDMAHHLHLLNHYEYPSKKNTLTQAVVYFTHSGSILKLLAHLGLYKDKTKLAHNTYDMIGHRRKWRVSQIDSFASNLAFVLYECQDGYKILFMHQERNITLPGCPSNDLCPIDTLKLTLKDSIYNCDFDTMCNF